MLNFDYENRTRIVFGKDTHKGVGSLIAPIAKKVLLHYGGGSIKRTGLYDTVIQSLRAADIEIVELGGVQPNPRVALVQQGVALCLRENVELILAVGGGSVIDSAKGIGLGVKNQTHNLWEIYARDLPTNGSLPVATLLTIPAAGSESSPNSVLSNDLTQQKYGCNRPSNRPVLSIIDPTLFYTLPKNQIANGIADMMCHVFERYFSNTTDTGFSDALCEATLRTILIYGPMVYRDPQNYDAWCQVSLAGTMAHNNVLGIGREQDWASHKMEHELSARYDIAHGAGLAVITPGWMRYVQSQNQQRFLDFAMRVMGVSPLSSIDETIEAGIRALEAFFAQLHLPSRLSEFGVDQAGISIMAKRAVTNEDGGERRVGYLLHLQASDIQSIFESVQ
ncbi:MAG: iron-containing alcohol dehydrogenase [Clostridia bacterium]